VTDTPRVIVAPPFNPERAALNFAARLLRADYEDHELLHSHLAATAEDVPAIREAVRDLADRLTSGMVLTAPTATRTEWGIWWHADDPDGIVNSAYKIGSRDEAVTVAGLRVGVYGVTGYTLVTCEHREFADRSTWIGPWKRVETVMPS
jgi:hypothetical protein